MMNPTEKRLVKKRIQLILEQPFFGNLATRLILVEDPGCQYYAWTDGTNFGYNPELLAELTDENLLWLLAHEVGHLILFHHTRQGTREHEQWNEAADYAVNALLRNGFIAPPGILDNPTFDGMTAEQVYNLLPKPSPSPKDEPQDQGQPKEKGQGAPKPGRAGEVRPAPGIADPSKPATPQEIKEIESATKENIAFAETYSNKYGSGPGTLQKTISDIIRPEIPWETLLRRFMDKLEQADYSWMKPNRRYLSQGLYLPSIMNEPAACLGIGVDLSGSINQKQIDAAAAELSGILALGRIEAVVIYFDTQVVKIERYTPEDLPLKFDVRAGGGTDFRPLFQYIENQAFDPSALIIFTDLDGIMPVGPFPYPVLWINTGRRELPAPFGEVITMPGM
jgi:predicted metal-dependent peptidase